MRGYNPHAPQARTLSAAAIHARAHIVAQEARFEAQRCRRFASGLSNGDLRDAMEDIADELDEMAEDIET